MEAVTCLSSWAARAGMGLSHGPVPEVAFPPGLENCPMGLPPFLISQIHLEPSFGGTLGEMGTL